jgi:hypothetical protein
MVLRSDVDGDLFISKSEIDDIIQKLSSISGVQLREESFRLVIEGKSGQSVMDVMKNLLDEDTPDQEK